MEESVQRHFKRIQRRVVINPMVKKNKHKLITKQKTIQEIETNCASDLCIRITMTPWLLFGFWKIIPCDLQWKCPNESYRKSLHPPQPLGYVSMEFDGWHPNYHQDLFVSGVTFNHWLLLARGPSEISKIHRWLLQKNAKGLSMRQWRLRILHWTFCLPGGGSLGWGRIPAKISRTDLFQSNLDMLETWNSTKEQEQEQRQQQSSRTLSPAVHSKTTHAITKMSWYAWLKRMAPDANETTIVGWEPLFLSTWIECGCVVLAEILQHLQPRIAEWWKISFNR